MITYLRYLDIMIHVRYKKLNIQVTGFMLYIYNID